MKLRQRLLLSFIGVAIVVTTIFGTVAYYITINYSNEEKIHLLQFIAQKNASDLSALTKNTTNKNLIHPFSNHNFNDIFSYVLLNENNKPLARTSATSLLDLKHPLSQLNKLNFQHNNSGNLEFGHNKIYWALAKIPETKYKLLLIHSIYKNTALMQVVGSRFAITAAIIIWLAIWGALILSARFSNQLDKQNAILVHQALHDHLTDLPNRYLLYDRLQQAIYYNHHEKTPITLLLIEINRFKEIIDTLGHRSGDTLLKQISQRLKNIVFEQNTVARLDGDQFAILLNDTHEKNIDIVVKSIIKILEEPFPVDELMLETGVTIGIATFPDHGKDPDSLIRHADVALYQANKDGRSFMVYSSEADPNSIDQLTLMSDLHRALNNDELELYYQPKIDLKSHKVIGVEALIRWQHPERGFITPDYFIPMAEQSGLIKPITAWVMEQALKQNQEWEKIDIKIKMAINVSQRNLYDHQLTSQFRNLMQQMNISTHHLEIEITETAIMSDPSHSLATLHALHEMGIKLSIDDFGTGFTSLSHLKDLPIDELKIDKSFIMGMPHDDKDLAIVSTIIELAHNMGYSVVAEGVESQEIMDMLIDLKCNTVQGYYISRPLPAKMFEHWLITSGWHK